MLLARRPMDEKEDNLSNEILKQYDMKDEFKLNSVKYLLIIDDRIVGLSKVEYYENIGVLKYVVISKDDVGDNLGDALLRSIFNYCLNNKIEKVYYPELNPYLLKKGFKESKNSLDIEGKKEEFLLEIDLDIFFTAPCQGSKGIE